MPTEHEKLVDALLLSASKAALACGKSVRTWRSWDSAGKIPRPVRIGRSTMWRADVLLLARKFADGGISDPCLVALLRYNWPGNIRELQSKIAVAKAKQKADGKTTIEIDHLDLPADIVKSAGQLDARACRRELWTLADEMARCEGFESGSGLQRRAGEIMGVSESQASKMYGEFGLIGSTAASA